MENSNKKFFSNTKKKKWVETRHGSLFQVPPGIEPGLAEQWFLSSNWL